MNHNKNKNQGNFKARNNQNFGKNNFAFKKREMHKAICDKCKKECEVPFKPIEGRPVFCKECHAKMKGFSN